MPSPVEPTRTTAVEYGHDIPYLPGAQLSGIDIAGAPSAAFECDQRRTQERRARARRFKRIVPRRGTS